MTLEERSDLVLSFARVLFVNGQSTDQTLEAACRLADSVGVDSKILVHWGEIQLHAEDHEERLISVVCARPTGVDMNRVASTMEVINDLQSGRLASSEAIETIGVIAQAHPSPDWLFTLAASAGAVALAVIFGVQHLPAAGIIFVSAGAGAILRRRLGRFSANVFIQPFCASLLAGLIGALAFRYQLSSTLRLVAVCPCMVLVPGPHLLNGALDLVRGRIGLGTARLVFAALVILAISAGLLVGLAIFGVSFPVDPNGRSVTLWLDTIAAGVAVFAYSMFFSTPLRMVAWPIAVGMFAHAMRWLLLVELHRNAATGAMVACLIAGLILAPVAHKWRMPFTAVGFAAVVSMMPGVFLFRMAGGLVQLTNPSLASFGLLSATVSDGMTAIAIILAMSFGLIVPKMISDRLFGGSRQTTSEGGTNANR